jgi:sucrose phosphorylase
MRAGAHLIAYADRLAGSLRGLRELLEGPLAGVFAGVHVLPFFTPFDGADAGFDPVDHTAVDPRLGAWDDVRALAATYEVMADAIVNHVSASSPRFRDWLERGDASPYAGMFLTLGAVYPHGVIEQELLAIYRPRPGLPFTPVSLADGSRRLAWTTFTPQQIDLDVAHPRARAYLREVLAALAAGGVSVVRMDAVGYAVKTPGTSSFMTPQTFAFIRWLSQEARGLGLEVLVEVHSYWRRQVEIARQVDLVYDFALPPLILHALTTGDGAALRAWWEERPRNAVTVLDTHDGIGVIDVGADQSDRSLAGLLEEGAINALVEAIHANSGGTSARATGAAASNLDLYQVNCTFYDALGRDDTRYLLARALQVFTPGIPQVYYVGLLAGGNDMQLLARTGVGRDVNRHYYTHDEVLAALERPVVRTQLDILRARSRPAFRGEWSLGGSEAAPELRFRGPAGESAVLACELRSGAFEVWVRDADGEHRITPP